MYKISYSSVSKLSGEVGEGGEIKNKSFTSFFLFGL
jgi:hypothetical protein